MGSLPRPLRRLAVLAALVAAVTVWRNHMIDANERRASSGAPASGRDPTRS